MKSLLSSILAVTILGPLEGHVGCHDELDSMGLGLAKGI